MAIMAPHSEMVKIPLTDPHITKQALRCTPFGGFPLCANSLLVATAPVANLADFDRDI